MFSKRFFVRTSARALDEFMKSSPPKPSFRREKKNLILVRRLRADGHVQGYWKSLLNDMTHAWNAVQQKLMLKDYMAAGTNHGIPENLLRLGGTVVFSLKDSHTKKNELMQIHKDYPSLYAAAEVAMQELVKITKHIARRTGGIPQYRKTLKDLGRVQEKANIAGTPAKVLDIAASRVVYQNLKDLYQGLMFVHKHYSIADIIDRFVHPQGVGYRDIQLTMKMSNNHYAELRLEVKEINAVAEIEHKMYQKRRSIEFIAQKENRDFTSEENRRMDLMFTKASELYSKAWNLVIIDVTGGEVDGRIPRILHRIRNTRKNRKD